MQIQYLRSDARNNKKYSQHTSSLLLSASKVRRRVQSTVAKRIGRSRCTTGDVGGTCGPSWTPRSTHYLL